MVLLSILCVGAFLSAIFVTGMHDASNAIAVPVRTRTMGDTAALITAALFNGIGVFAAYLLITDMSVPWIAVPSGHLGLPGLTAALITAALWGVATWALRMPASSTHALIGALAGVAWYARVDGEGSRFIPAIFDATLLPLLYLPPLIFLLSWLLVIPFYRLAIRSSPSSVNRHSREVLAVSASAISLLHGMQTGYLYLLVLHVLGAVFPLPTRDLLPWHVLTIALVLAAGTLTGGRRIGYTFAYRMVRLDPMRGAVAQGTTALMQALGYFLLQLPFSSSHLATASALGAGVNQRFNSVKPKIVANIMLTWFVTLPACFLCAIALMMALDGIFG